MKGVNKRVIEINEPDSEYIEKVLVFLRQKDGRVNVARARQEAEGMSAHLCAGAVCRCACPRRNGLLPGQWGWRGWCGCS